MLTPVDSSAVQRFVSVVQVLAGRIADTRPSEAPQVFACALDAFPDRLEPTGLLALRNVLTGAACHLELASAPNRTSSSFSRELIRIQTAVSLTDLREAFSDYLDGLRRSEVSAAPERRAADERVTAALAYMREHFTRPRLGLEEIAGAVHLSKWHLDRLFRRHTGMCFKKLLREIRMEEARQLLGNTLLTIKEVASHVGYSHVTEFDRQFKRSFQSTPTDWRAKQLLAQRQARIPVC
jgi:AraC-like DNA-binding protein